MSKKNLTGLGKGLSALIPDINFKRDENGFDRPNSSISAQSSNENIHTGHFIQVKDIIKNPYQPRKVFEKEALEDLKQSILEHGVIQPITVRKVSAGYELIAGERRLRASLELGLETIPAYVIAVDSNSKMLELAIIENIQRENLNPLEVAEGYLRLIEECRLTQEEVAQKVSKDRASVANFLRLIKLPDNIKSSLEAKEITMGHAKALLSLLEDGRIESAWSKVLEQNLSVRATEALVKKLLENKPKTDKKESKESENSVVLRDIEHRLQQKFGTDVKIKLKSGSSGNLEISFYSAEDLDRLLEILELENE